MSVCVIARQSILMIFAYIKVHLTVLIMLLWRRDTTLLDLSFAISLLLSHTDIISRMKNLLVIIIGGVNMQFLIFFRCSFYLSFFILGILIPTVLSPVMLHLWVVKGVLLVNLIVMVTDCSELLL